jgi:hypothetical protein
MDGRGRRGRRPRRDLWQHIGGGCMVGRFAKGVEYPCDESYENVETGEEAALSTTERAHASIPHEASCLRDLTQRPGVQLAWRGWREED